MSQSNVALARRYAKALFDLALSEKVLDGVHSDLESIERIINTSLPLKKSLSNPVISRQNHVNMMEGLFKKISAQGLTRKFIITLAQNRRMGALSDIIRAYKLLLEEHKGEVAAQVISAAPLSAAKVTKLEKALSQALNKAVKITVKEDPSILGGIIVKIGSKMLDSSLLEKINRLEFVSKQAIASV